MNTEKGWIKFYREWLDNPIITKDSEHLAVWTYLFVKAIHTEKDSIFRGKQITLKAGQLLALQKDICEILKIEPTKLRRILKMLKSAELIDYQTDNHKTLITLVVWGFYQGEFAEQNAELMPNQCRTKQETENEKEKRSKREKDKEKEIDKNERMKEYLLQQPAVSCQQSEERDFLSKYDKNSCMETTQSDNGHAPVPCFAAGKITQNACMESTQGVVWNQSQTVCNQPSGCMSFAKCENDFGHAPVPCLDELFSIFWQAYPKKVGKGYAYECFKKIRVSRKLLDTMLEAIDKQKKSDMWKRDKGQYIPNPSTWLNQKRWEDDLDGETDDGQIPWSKMKLPGLYF